MIYLVMYSYHDSAYEPLYVFDNKFDADYLVWGLNKEEHTHAYTYTKQVEGRRYYVCKSANKFADGFYGWDCNIHSDCQVFSHDDFPYKVQSFDKFQPVLVGYHEKPSVCRVNEFLEKGIEEKKDADRYIQRKLKESDG